MVDSQKSEKNSMNVGGALGKFLRSIRADFEATESQRAKYKKDHVRKRLAVLLVTDIGIQSMAAIRLMQLARDLKIPFGSEVLSRLIRYLYNMEIHPGASIDPGVTLIHGVGLTVDESAHVSSDCIVAHNVTLGAVVDPETGETRAPVLKKNVHVGPGVQILGAITIGENSKIMAGASVTESVPPYTLIKPPAPICQNRTPGKP
jgi:serine O-acetyltransferase